MDSLSSFLILWQLNNSRYILILSSVQYQVFPTGLSSPSSACPTFPLNSIGLIVELTAKVLLCHILHYPVTAGSVWARTWYRRWRVGGPGFRRRLGPSDRSACVRYQVIPHVATDAPPHAGCTTCLSGKEAHIRLGL